MGKKVGAVLLVVALAVSLGAVPAAPAAAHTESDPLEQTLYAGQNIDVGTVKVWNDEDTLCVEYELSEEALDAGWLIFETHLAVAADLAGIPTNKSGNPIPGHFQYGETLEEGVPSWQQCINLEDAGFLAGDELYIAAHAVVISPIEECWEEVWQIGDVEERDPDTGLLFNYADEFNWESPAGPATLGPSLAISQPAFANPFIVETTPDEEFPFNSNTVRNYATDFDVQWTGSLPFGGKLTTSWSPGQSAFERKIVSGDGITTATFEATGTPRPGEGWFFDTFPLVENSVAVEPLGDGTHTINFKHTQGDGTYWDWVRLEKPCEQEETAWGAGTRFVDRGNWATYFTYRVQGWLLVETLTVPANSMTGTDSGVLQSGKSYMLKAMGTWQDTSQPNHYIDAEYTTFDGWTTHMDGTSSWGPDQKDLQVNGQFVDWGSYSSDHVYTLMFAGGGSEVNFRIFDGHANASPPTIQPAWYGDNVGYLTVEIYEWD